MHEMKWRINEIQPDNHDFFEGLERGVETVSVFPRTLFALGWRVYAVVRDGMRRCMNQTPLIGCLGFRVEGLVCSEGWNEVVE